MDFLQTFFHSMSDKNLMLYIVQLFLTCFHFHPLIHSLFKMMPGGQMPMLVLSKLQSRGSTTRVSSSILPTHYGTIFVKDLASSSSQLPYFRPSFLYVLYFIAFFGFLSCPLPFVHLSRYEHKGGKSEE